MVGKQVWGSTAWSDPLRDALARVPGWPFVNRVVPWCSQISCTLRSCRSRLCTEYHERQDKVNVIMNIEVFTLAISSWGGAAAGLGDTVQFITKRNVYSIAVTSRAYQRSPCPMRLRGASNGTTRSAGTYWQGCSRGVLSQATAVRATAVRALRRFKTPGGGCGGGQPPATEENFGF